MRHRDGAKFEKSFKIENFNFFSFLRHEVPFKAKNNREAVVVCAIHVVKRPSKRSVLVQNISGGPPSNNARAPSTLTKILESSAPTLYPTWYVLDITLFETGCET